MGIQTTTYKRRLREHSGLKPQPLLIALTIADLRWEAKRQQHEPLPLTLEQIAAACGMSRRTASDHLNECIRSGWIIGRRVFRDGRQKPNEYFISDPTAPDTECRRLHSVIASGGQILRADAPHNVRRRLPTVVRSNNKGASDPAPQSGGAGSDEQGQPETPAAGGGTGPALGGADPHPGEQVHAAAAGVIDAALARHQSQRRDAASGVAELAAEPFRPNPFAPTNFVCPSCNARPGHTCRRPKPGTAFGTEPRPQPHDQRVAAAAAAARHRLAVVPS